MSTQFKTSVALIILCLSAFSGVASAQDLKERMHARLPAIADMMTRGVIGENNQGYLEVRGGNADKQVVAAENQDRKSVYQSIAQKRGISAEAVGRQRAQQIAAIARPGEWLQNSGGAWYQKK